MGYQEDFIKQIAPYVTSWRNFMGYGVASAIIAQACIESAYGLSNKAQYHNYFGLKYKPNRVTCNNGTFTDTSYEWKDGKYVPISCQWYSFDDMYNGVGGYFQFINYPRYDNARSQTTPQQYLQLLWEDGYATGPKYVESCMRVVEQYNLTQYDGGGDMVQYDTSRKPDSPLASQAIWTFNCSVRNTKLKPRQFKFIPHCTAGMSSAVSTARRFQNPNVKASATYCIGGDGDIVQNVPEEYRPWTTGGDLSVNGMTGADMDHMAFTFEIANSALGGSWPMSDKAINSLVFLMVDICQRYGIPRVIWNNDKYFSSKPENYNTINVHRWYARKSCPGDFLMALMPDVATVVNNLLAAGPVVPTGNYVINGIDYSPVFNPTYYSNNYEDLRIAFGTDANLLWQHFRDFGMNELRQADKSFNAVAYKTRYPDLQAAYGDDNPMYYWHWLVFGKNEGRIAT